MFNLRVYGLLIKDNRLVLVSDEHISGLNITKFPGGGLQFGEGTIDCLKREFMEELLIEINVISHFYTTDFFQPSFLNKNHQVISIYYSVETPETSRIPVTDEPFDFKYIGEGAQNFRWLELNKCLESDVTFPIDRHVLRMLKLRDKTSH